MATLLEAKSLKKKFNIFKNLWFDVKVAVKSVSLHVDEGEIVGLLGPNGAGKSTSLKMISGDVTPDEGSVFFDGKEITDWPMYKRCLFGLGYMAQDNTLFKNLSVENNLIGVLQMLGYSQKECRERCDELVEMFDLKKVINTAAGRLSGGERRRLEVARALAKQPKMIILDEPFAGVDPKIVEKVQDLICDLREKWGIAILITDHNVPPIVQIADRGYVIHEGEVIFDGGVYDLVNDEKVQNVYLGSNSVGSGFIKDASGRVTISRYNKAHPILMAPIEPSQPDATSSKATSEETVSAPAPTEQTPATVEQTPVVINPQNEQTPVPPIQRKGLKSQNAAPEDTDLSELLKSVHTISSELDKTSAPSETLATFIQKTDAEAQETQKEIKDDVAEDSNQTAPQRKTIPSAPIIKPFRRKN